MKQIMLMCLLISATDSEQVDVHPSTSIDPELASSTVGLPRTLEQIVLPGSPLRVKKLVDRNQPFILRIIDSYPHGDDHRYDLEYQALEPGQYDLTDYLERVDGSPINDLPPINVLIESTLPSGPTQPNSLADSQVDRFGGYRIWMGLAVLGWIVGLLALIFVGRRSGSAVEDTSPDQLEPVDRLEPLIAAAKRGDLSQSDRASLERAVIGFWTEELKLNDCPPATISQRLARHEQAGPMLNRLEHWLHAPPNEHDHAIDLANVLEPIVQLKQRPLESSA
ncbi:MAG: hypothetical protein AAF539_13810 [Planctomycetota bacterium]